ncbi:hypothetical protein MtrunA17_Chr3g0085811 [Medicago truncatula]|uniref:Uncharacterized protein n=1 Tax=Medicago truncatula TaxID=3880 RepID=A0A396ISQ8_MEDTR|nr:hypothetical protein MtrunA17_Chr3g0085811 [Medicago truncatula]
MLIIGTWLPLSLPASKNLINLSLSSSLPYMVDSSMRAVDDNLFEGFQLTKPSLLAQGLSPNPNSFFFFARSSSLSSCSLSLHSNGFVVKAETKPNKLVVSGSDSAFSLFSIASVEISSNSWSAS